MHGCRRLGAGGEFGTEGKLELSSKANMESAKSVHSEWFRETGSGVWKKIKKYEWEGEWEQEEQGSQYREFHRRCSEIET